MKHQNLLTGLLTQLRGLRTANSTSVAVIFALTTIPVLGFVGATIDFSRASNYRSKLIAAADAAAIGSVAKSSPAMTATSNMMSDGPIPIGVTHAINIFNSQIAGKRRRRT